MADVLGGVLRSQRRLEVAVLEQGGEPTTATRRVCVAVTTCLRRSEVIVEFICI
jgi:hypothetical protein